MALVTSPKNQMFYSNEIPLEMFLQDNVASIRIIYHDRIVYSKKEITSNHLLDNLSFTDKEITDRELIFEFYDQKGALLKLESIIVLTGEKEVEWPTISLSTDMKDLNENKEIKIKLNLKNGDVFTLGNEVRYLFSHHIGWTHGELRQWAIDPGKKEQTFQDGYSIPDESPLLGLYVGVDIRYGKFIKTIYDHQFVYRGDWADPIRLK